MRKGYLLFGEGNWLDFHLRNSLGGTVVYCRGAGAPVRSLYPGDLVFCLRSGEGEHHVRLWGYFGWYERLPVADAWAKYGTALGAADEDGWSKLVARLPALAGRPDFGAVVLRDVAAPDPPVPLAAVNVSTRRATKGRTLSPEEVERILAAMAATAPPLAPYEPTGEDSREAVNRQLLARLGRASFRQAALRRYGGRCLVSGCALDDILEAAHICPYRGEQDNHPDNSLLLRCDLHTLFDLDLLGIDPATLTVHLHPSAAQQGYAQFHGVVLSGTVQRPSRAALALRWQAFQRRLRFQTESHDHEEM